MPDTHLLAWYPGNSLSIGACSIFSLRGIRKINELVGDDSFARIISSLETPSLGTRRILGSSNTPHPLPPNDVIIDCVNGLECIHDHGLARKKLIKFFQTSS